MELGVQLAPAQELALALKVGLVPAPGLEGLREVTLAPALAWLGQDPGLGQALPVALECSGALQVDLGQGEESGSHTCLTFPCLSREGKGVNFFGKLWPV